MDFDIGSNRYRNAAPSIEIEGMPHLSFEHNRRYNEMTLRGFLYDTKGNLVGKIVESSLAMNVQGEFEMRSEPSVVKVLRRETEEVILEVKFRPLADCNCRKRAGRSSEQTFDPDTSRFGGIRQDAKSTVVAVMWEALVCRRTSPWAISPAR